MAGDWSVRPLEDCMAVIIDYRGKTPTKTSSGIPLITAKVVKGGRIETPDEFIGFDDYVSWMRRGIPEAGDVVVTTEAPMGEVAQLGAGRIVLAQRLIALRGKPGVLDNGFLKFLMQSEGVQHQLRARASGTTVLGIKQSELRKILLTLPSLPEQRAIARILGALDDKIELNRQMNQTLEAIARAIFKSWFVDFDPVRAKMNGEPYPLDAATLALFPDRLVESELGEIPEGWEVEPLSQHVDARKGLSYNGDGLTDKGLPMHNLNSLLEGGGYKHEGIKFYKGDYKERHLLRAGDLIVANTEQGFDELLIGYAAMVPTYLGESGLYSHHLYRVTPLPTSHLTRCYLYFMFNGSEYHDIVAGYANGTTVNMLPADALQKPLSVVPPVELVSRFDQLAATIFSKEEANYVESRCLTELRDTLLPKLISGELRVPEAQTLLTEESH